MTGGVHRVHPYLPVQRNRVFLASPATGRYEWDTQMDITRYCHHPGHHAADTAKTGENNKKQTNERKEELFLDTGDCRIDDGTNLFNPPDL